MVMHIQMMKTRRHTGKNILMGIIMHPTGNISTVLILGFPASGACEDSLVYSRTLIYSTGCASGMRVRSILFVVGMYTILVYLHMRGGSGSLVSSPFKPLQEA